MHGSFTSLPLTAHLSVAFTIILFFITRRLPCTNDLPPSKSLAKNYGAKKQTQNYVSWLSWQHANIKCDTIWDLVSLSSHFMPAMNNTMITNEWARFALFSFISSTNSLKLFYLISLEFMMTSFFSVSWSAGIRHRAPSSLINWN